MFDKAYKIIPIQKISANKNQPRNTFDNQKLEELALSIKENGLLQPIIVRKKDRNYQIVAGERRYRASVLAGLKEIPCIITTYDDREVDTMAIIENIQREDLSVIEEARAYQVLLQTYHYSQKELAQKVGKQQSTIANKIRLLKLDPDVMLALEQKQITERHARAMLSIDATLQRKVLKVILEKSLNVKQTEAYIKKLQQPKKPKAIKKVSKNVKIALNTLHQATSMIKKTGIELYQEEKEKEDEYVITLHIKK